MKYDSMDYGARIERGRILAKTDDGKYVVDSLTRCGLVTEPIASMGSEYENGDIVYFFLFDDGDGRIL